MIYLSASAIEAYSRCPAVYEYKYRHKLSDGRHRSALSVGSAMHAAAAALRRGSDLPTALTVAALSLDADAPSPGTLQDISSDAAKVWAMICGYCEAWKGAQLRSDSNEVIMSAKLSDSLTLRGIADAIVTTDGAAMVYEMKTTSDTVDDMASCVRESIQVQLYMYLATQCLDLDVRGCIVDIAKKPTTRRKKNESLREWGIRAVDAYRADPRKYFKRAIVDYDESAIDRALAIAAQIGEMIINSERNGYLAVKGAGCKTPYGWCEYRGICWHGDADSYSTMSDTRYEERQ